MMTRKSNRNDRAATPAAKRSGAKVGAQIKKAPKASSRKTPASTTALQRIEALGIDSICASIQQGASQGSIADSLKVDRADFSRWLSSDDQRSARVREARSLSALHWDEQAERVLLDASEIQPLSLAKARELASHYRWRAKCYAPKVYGDKVGLEHGGTVSVIGQILDELDGKDVGLPSTK